MALKTETPSMIVPRIFPHDVSTSGAGLLFMVVPLVHAAGIRMPLLVDGCRDLGVARTGRMSRVSFPATLTLVEEQVFP